MLKPDPFRRKLSDFDSPDPGERASRTDPARHPVDAEAVTRNLFLVPAEGNFGAGRREYRTGLLSAAVIALCLLLGWLVGRAGWNMAVNRAEGQSPNVSEQVLAAAQESPYPVASLPSPVASTETAEFTSPAPVSLSAPNPASKAKVEAPPQDGGLVMYERGKVVFRTAPPKATTAKAPADENGSPASDQTSSATNGYLLTRVVPKYPEQARLQGIQGPVVMKALVGKDGSVQDVRVIGGAAELVQAAVDAVRQWRFQPHLLKGNPVEFETQVTLKFSLP
jgi:TonB family protein